MQDNTIYKTAVNSYNYITQSPACACTPSYSYFITHTGASKQLGTIIEGESLLNDGAAIVLFNVLINELIPGQSQTGKQISFVPSG